LPAKQFINPARGIWPAARISSTVARFLARAKMPGRFDQDDRRCGQQARSEWTAARQGLHGEMIQLCVLIGARFRDLDLALATWSSA